MKTVLVVDDEIGALTLIGIMLERGGYVVLKARDALEAMKILLWEQTPDLIVIDAIMPYVDGLDLCELVRHRSATASTPVLMLVPRGDAETIYKAIEMGANDFLPKPVLYHDLIAKIHKMLV